MIAFLQLRMLSGGADVALLFLRILTGAFLVHGVWDNVSDGVRMAEFAGFLKASGFPRSEVAAPFSVYTQLFAGLALIPGFLTRLAGLIVFATFVIGYLMVHAGQTFREGWPALALVGIGLLLATMGGGRYAVDYAMRSGR